MTSRLAVVAFAISSLAAAPLPFSHRLHLRLKLECATCHASVTTSAKLEDNNLPSKQACVRCHNEKMVRIESPARTMLVRFGHARHLKLGNAAPVIAAAIDRKTYLSPPDDIRRHLDTSNPCVACHRGLDESDAVNRANLPQMADCLVCHSKIDPPFSCELCHDPDQTLRPASHTPDYIDQHSSGKIKLDKPSCAVCHGRRFRCQGCH